MKKNILFKMTSLQTKSITLVLIFITSFSYAQTKISPDEADSSLIIYKDAIEVRLVELAIEGPSVKISQSQSKINEYQLKVTRNTWVNLFTISANYNNQTYTQANSGSSILFPGTTVGFTVPLGTILSSGARVKSAKQQIFISEFTREQLIRNIKAEVIGKYRQYLSYGQLISIQNQTVDDEETAYLQAKEQFRNGKIKIEDYNTAQKLYNLELTKKINLQTERELLKLEIERITGRTLESIVKEVMVKK